MMERAQAMKGGDEVGGGPQDERSHLPTSQPCCLELHSYKGDWLQLLRAHSKFLPVDLDMGSVLLVMPLRGHPPG